LKAAGQGIERMQDLAGIAQEIVAIFRQSDTPRRAVEQRPANLLLQPPDLMADGRLRQVQPSGRPGKASRLFDSHEGA